MKRARWVAITRPLYKQHSLRASKRRCGKRKSRGIYIIRRVVGSMRTRSSGQVCRFQASLPRTMSSDSDTYSPCTTMEPCAAVTLKVNVALALCRIMNNADRTKKIPRKEELPKANLRVTYGVTAIKTSWTPTMTIQSTMSVLPTEVVEVVGIEVVIELR